MKLVTRLATAGTSPDRLMVLIHGRGADEYDLEGLIPHLDPQGRFLVVLPRGPLALPPGFQWYETYGIPKGGDGFAEALDALDDLLDGACAEHGYARHQALVAGFSQGASLALALGLRAGPDGRSAPCGVLAMSGFLAEVDGVDYAIGSGSPPVMIAHGTHDDLVEARWGRAAARTLAEAGAPVVYREYPMAHQVAMEELSDAASWLSSVLAWERPDEGAPPDPPDVPDVPVADAAADSADVPDLATNTSPGQADALVRSVRTADFEAEVLRSDVPVIVDFWAPWCQPCRAVAPIVEQIAAMRAGSYKVVKVNIDEEPRLAQAFEVQSIPLIGLFRNGRMERKAQGAMARPELEAALGMLVIP